MREHQGKSGIGLMAIVRWVKRGFRDRPGGDPTIGVLVPCDQDEDEVDFFLFMQVIFLRVGMPEKEAYDVVPDAFRG